MSILSLLTAFLFLVLFLSTCLKTAICAVSALQLASHLNKTLRKLEHPLATAEEIACIVFDLKVLLQIAEEADECGNIDLVSIIDEMPI